MTGEERRELADRIAKQVAGWAETSDVIGTPRLIGDSITFGVNDLVVGPPLNVRRYGSTYAVTVGALRREPRPVPMMPPEPTGLDDLEVIARGRRIEAMWHWRADRGFRDEDRDHGITYEQSVMRDASATSDHTEPGPYAHATQAKHLPAPVVLHLIAAMEGVGCGAQRTSIAVALGAPEKVVVAKLSKLLRRGWIDGCVCGCRGDFSVRAR